MLVSQLSESTITTGQKYSQTPLKQVITVGIRHIIEPKNIILMANSVKKAAIIKNTIDTIIPNKNFPSSILYLSENVILMVDAKAGKLL
jgi:6-phosphogluconolactonase/glucosamine-6-phosphate isomerase/deaminase